MHLFVKELLEDHLHLDHEQTLVVLKVEIVINLKNPWFLLLFILIFIPEPFDLIPLHLDVMLSLF